MSSTFLIIEFLAITAASFKSNSSYPIMMHATQWFSYQRKYVKDRQRKQGTGVRKNIEEKTDHENQESLTSPIATYSFHPLPQFRCPTTRVFACLPCYPAPLSCCCRKDPRGAVWVYSQPRALMRVVGGDKIRIREYRWIFYDEEPRLRYRRRLHI